MTSTTPLVLAGGPPARGHGRLEVRGITKRYGGLQALDDVSVTVSGGEVLALCGANGAGKSTLVKILAGVERLDSGMILLDDAPVGIHRPQDSADLGLGFVHQELNLVPQFTGLENMAMGAPGPRRFGLLDRKGVRRRAREVQQLLDYEIPLDTPVDALSTSDRWMVSLGRSLMRPARFVAMDEPTASFTEEEAARLYAVIHELTSSGVGVLYISHRLEEVLRVADRVTVLRGGTLVGTHRAEDLSVTSLTQEIVGHDVKALTPHAALTPGARGPVRLAVRDLGRPPQIAGASFALHAGEIVGIAGLVGAGRTELARLLIGADRSTVGSMELDGVPYAPRSPHDAIRAGVALVPEERRSQGLILTETIDINMAMAGHGKARSLVGVHRPARSRRAAGETATRLGITTDSVTRPVLSLSGGNQQKVLVGNYVRTAPRVLILDEPTVGVDVGARADLYEIIAGLAADGTSILVISSDFDELAICDRVLVMRHGAIVEDIPAHRVSKAFLTQQCFASGDTGT